MGNRFKRKIKLENYVTTFQERTEKFMRELADYCTGSVEALADRVGMVMQLQEVLVDASGLTHDQIKEKVKAKQEELKEKAKARAEAEAVKAAEAEKVKEQERYEAMTPLEREAEDKRRAELAKKQAQDKECEEHNARIQAEKDAKRERAGTDPATETGSNGGSVQAPGETQG